MADTSLSRLIKNIKQVEKIHDLLQKAESKRLIHEKRENNEYIAACYKGAGAISEKWNVKVYEYSNRKLGWPVVCNDWAVFDAIVGGDWGFFEMQDLPVISIDDAGWGFPLCGVMVGASDGNKVVSEVVPVEFFQKSGMTNKKYMDMYSTLGRTLLNRFGFVTPQSHRIEICTGYVNVQLKEDLRALGYDVRVVEIKGLLQDRLEDHYREHVKSILGRDLYYDPKEMNKSDIPREYKKCVKFGQMHCPHLLKSGWNSLQGED